MSITIRNLHEWGGGLEPRNHRRGAYRATLDKGNDLVAAENVVDVVCDHILVEPSNVTPVLQIRKRAFSFLGLTVDDCGTLSL